MDYIECKTKSKAQSKSIQITLDSKYLLEEKKLWGEKTAKLCCWESKKEREKNVIKFPLKKYLWFLKKIYGFVFLSQNDPYNNLILFVSKGISKKRKFIYSFFSSALF